MWTPEGERSRHKNRDRKRNEARENHHLEFIGVDGEGVTLESGEHRYVLLSVGDKSFHLEGLPLDYEDIFSFLWECYLSNAGKNPKVFVGFYLTYDFAQWFKTLAENRAVMLLTKRGVSKRMRKDGFPVPFPVRVGRWELDIMLNMKRFKLRPRGERGRYLTICDSGAFFQCSLLAAIDPKRRKAPLIPQGQYNLIKEGKEKRSTAAFDEAMIHYNVAENDALARLLEELNEGLVDVGIRLKRNQWFGPGQAAQAWLNNIGAPTSVDFFASTPGWASEALRGTYFGGWFEIPVHGIVPGTTYEYDLNSAYPWVMQGLPCCLHGKWRQGNGRKIPPIGGLLMRYATVSGKDPFFGAMTHRESGSCVLRPKSTRGWFWDHELEAAKNAGLVDRVNTSRWVHYEPCNCPAPLRELNSLYLDRIRVGKETPGGKARKLVYNSCYGKFAQSIGKPKYGNPLYASLITAGCRTRILEAIASHPSKSRDVVMIATDGVYFRSEHPSLDVDAERLGAWGSKTKENLSLFKPGVYWDDQSRKQLAEGKTVQLQSRGVRASDLAKAIDQIDQMWQEFPKARVWPTLPVLNSFMVTSPRLALSRGKWNTCGQAMTGVETIQSADPSNKRNVSRITIDDGLIRTSPRKLYSYKLDSVAYDGMFGEEHRLDAAMQGIASEMGQERQILELLGNENPFLGDW